MSTLDDRIGVDVTWLRKRAMVIKQSPPIPKTSQEKPPQAADLFAEWAAREYPPLSITVDDGTQRDNPELTWHDYRSIELMLAGYEPFAGNDEIAALSEVADCLDPLHRLWFDKVMATCGFGIRYDLTTGRLEHAHALLRDAGDGTGWFSTWPEPDDPDVQPIPAVLYMPDDVTTVADIKAWVNEEEGQRRRERVIAAKTFEHHHRKGGPRKGLDAWLEKQDAEIVTPETENPAPTEVPEIAPSPRLSAPRLVVPEGQVLVMASNGEHAYIDESEWARLAGEPDAE